MRFNGECRVLFFLGWVLCWAGGWAVLGSEYLLRRQDQFTFYLGEAWGGLLFPFIVIIYADGLTMRTYRSIWHDFNELGLGTRVAEFDQINHLRHEMGRSTLLRSMRPPTVTSLRGHILAVSLWYYPLTHLEGSGTWKRFHEQFSLIILLTILIPAIVLAAVSYGHNIRLALWTLLVIGPCFLCAGYMLLKYAARRQAVVDYFSAWRAARHDIT